MGCNLSAEQNMIESYNNHSEMRRDDATVADRNKPIRVSFGDFKLIKVVIFIYTL